VEAYRETGKHQLIKVWIEGDVDDLPALFVDESKLRQALTYLVLNAARESAPGGEVVVKAEIENEEMVVSVHDQGHWNREVAPADVFENYLNEGPFKKTHPLTEEDLSLLLCKRIIQGHQGRIWASSDNGDGRVFSFSLPLARVLQNQPLER